MTQRVLVLGSTGSIGQQTLDLVRASRRPGTDCAPLEVVGLAARASAEAVIAQARELDVRAVSMDDPSAAATVRAALGPGVEVLEGERAAEELVRRVEFDVAIHGIVGAAGLRPSVAVLEKGGVLGLANKESLVIAGEILMPLAARTGGSIVPVDSEHSAVFQCLRGEDLNRVRRVHLTASGGPFRQRSAAEIASATPTEALAHPNWDMGPRVTIGSATLLNKALEVIELHHLFGLGEDKIHVVVHPQSIVHSMVEFVDGSVIAQMGPPDMRGAIHFALHHPDRSPAELDGFSFEAFRRLDFEEPDRERFPALDLGFRVVREGGNSGAVLNAADEVAVAAFLAGETDLPGVVATSRAALDARPATPLTLEGLIEADRWARDFARQHLRVDTGSAPAPNSAPSATQG